jgi:single-strand DNA-binding protein
MSLENEVRLAGNLARDPEAGRGSATKTREADFIGVVAFGKTAEFCMRYLAKGSGVLIRGHLKPRSWADPKTGEKKYEMSVVADEVSFPPKGGSGATGAAHAPAPGATAYEESEETDPFSLV